MSADRHASAQLLVLRPAGELLARPLPPAAGALRLQAADMWTPVRLAASLIAHRTTGTWRRGRVRGTATVDLVPAGPSSTLLVVDLHGTRPWRVPSREVGYAYELARALREALEAADTPRLAPVIELHTRRRPRPASASADEPVARACSLASTAAAGGTCHD